MSESRRQSPTPALGDSQSTGDPGGGSPLGFLCPVSWSWAVQWCCCSCWFASGIQPHRVLPTGSLPCGLHIPTISSTICLWDSSLHSLLDCLLSQAITTLALLRITSGNSTLQNKALREKQNKIFHSLLWNNSLISSHSRFSTCGSHLCCVPCHPH